MPQPSPSLPAAGPRRATLALSGNPRPGSRTAALAGALAAALSPVAGAPVAEIDLAAPHAPDDELRAEVAAAALLVVASPTYKATYTGLLKTFLDGFSGPALRGVVAVPVMVAAAPHHALAVEVHLRPLLVELGATCPTRGLFLQEAELADAEAAIAPWLEEASPVLEALLRARVTA